MFLCFFVLFHFISACTPSPQQNTCVTFCLPTPSLAPPPPTPSPLTITVTKIEKKIEKETITEKETKTITDEETSTLTLTTTEDPSPTLMETEDIPPFVFFPKLPSSNEETISSEEVKTDDMIQKSYTQASSSTLVECETNLPEVE